MRILLAADVFPPHCGGAGWSAYHLGRALQQRGHDLLAVVPQEGEGQPAERSYGGIAIRTFPYRAPRLPLLRNAARNERLWPRLGRFLARLAQREGYELIHGQHSQTIPAAVHAAELTGVPAVGTVRDYWPLCYDSTLLAAEGSACRRCDLPAVVRCLGRPLLGPLAPLLALAYPYMRGNVRRKARALAQADAVVAVSGHVAGRLRPIVPPERLHVVPNLVDLTEVDRIVAQPPEIPLPGPFLLFVGKLEVNKGIEELVATLRIAAATLPPPERPPLLLAGDGSRAAWAERELAAIGWPGRFLRWADHDEVLRLLHRTALLLFPSHWEEPLSRVLLEACACAAPILAMATGGTSEIVVDGLSGALTPAAVEPFAARMVGLLRDPAQRRRLGEGARRAAEERYAAPVVAKQIEALYRSVIAGRDRLKGEIRKAETSGR